MIKRTLLIALAALLLAPVLAEAAPRRVAAKRATRAATTNVTILARVFAAVRHTSARNAIQKIKVMPAKGKAARNITVRVTRLSNKAVILTKSGKPTRSAPMVIKLPYNKTNHPAGSNAQYASDTYAITVTTPSSAKPTLSNGEVLKGDLEFCEVGAVKWFKGYQIIDASGNPLAARPETNPWPTPDPESSCRE